MEAKKKRRQIAEVFIFSWLPEKSNVLTLTAFGVFSAVVHFLCFYLFQVVYPEPVRSELRPKPITLLDSTNSEVRSFVERSYDRVAFLDPASLNSTHSPLNVIRFAPSFAEVRPALRPLPRERPLSFPEDFDYSLPRSTIAPKTGHHALILSPNLLARGLAPHSIFEDYRGLFPIFPNDRIFLTVNPEGFPIEVTISGNGSDEEKSLVAVIQETLRFNPAPESRGNDPGWMELDTPTR